MDVLFQHVVRVRPLLSVGILIFLLCWESIAPALETFKRRQIYRAAHGVRNLLWGIGNSILVGMCLLWLWKWAIQQSSELKFGLLWRLDLSTVLHATLAILILDFWTYWWHWMNHRVSFLWRFHSVHHSDLEMDVTTATRFHTGEIVLSSLLRIPILFLVGIQLWHLAVYEVAMFAIVQFHHANIRLPKILDQLLSVVIVTPAMHHLHHSKDVKFQNSNYTSLLSVWDRIFETFTHGEDQSGYGIQGVSESSAETLRGMAVQPFSSSIGAPPVTPK